MAGNDRYCRAALALALALVLVTVGYRLGRGREEGGCRTLVQRTKAPEVVRSVPEEDGRPDSLLPGERIDLNRAGRYDLERLPGIGAARAQEILDYRRAHGPFTDVGQLDQVPGIGEGILSGLRDYVTVEGGSQ